MISRKLPITNPSSNAVTQQKRRVFSPARFDICGGWSDQLSYMENNSSAVINMAFGWRSKRCHQGVYPIMVDHRRVHTDVFPEYGTGLGTSSIVYACEYLLDHPNDPGYIAHFLRREKEEGTNGGYQDGPGGIERGVKLLWTESPHFLHIDWRADYSHPIVDHMVLFDTGQPRRSQIMGDKVRALFSDRDFCNMLEQIVDMTFSALSYSAEELVKVSLECWAMINSFIDQDLHSLPKSPLCWGHKLAGAGGGGFGMAYVKDPDDRKEVIRFYSDHQIWATIPILLDGAMYE